MSFGLVSQILRCVLLGTLLSGVVSAQPVVLPGSGSGPDRSALHVISDENYPPYLFRNAQGDVEGYLVDWWALWEQKTGIPVQLTATAWAEAQRKLLAGEADVIDMIYRTAPREPLYDFSEPYAELPVGIYSHASIGGITSIATLRGFQIGVQEGDACVDRLRENGITTLVFHPNYEALIRAALRSEVKVFCLDEAPANFYLYKLDAESQFRKAFELYVGRFHRAVRKGNTEVLRLVERGAAAITPEEDARLRRKWFGAPLAKVRIPTELLWALPALAVLGALLAVWNLQLRRRVRARTRELTEALTELGNAHRAALAAERDRPLGALFDAAPVALSYVRGEQIVSVNRSFSELFGYSLGDIPTLDEWWLRAYPDPVYRAWVERTWTDALDRAAAADGGVEALEYRITTKDGRELTMLVGGRLVEDGLIAAFADVTPIRQAQAAAEAANAAKGNFLATMSHEIRTPMNAIIGMTHLVARTPLTDAQRDHLRKILGASRQLLGIINDILDFSKIEAGKLEVVRSDFDLEALLGRVVDQLAERMGPKRLELRVDVEPEVPRWLVGDELRLGQILLNLGGNAVKFTERGSVTLRVRVVETAGAGLLLRFEISDTGIGIDEAQRARLFQSFQQADSSITRRYGGTGLGLAISKRLAELLGGTIGVDTAPGQGSTFWFTVRVEAGSVPADPSAAVAPDPAPIAGARALLVEDNDLNQEVALAFLKEIGLQVDVAPDGAVALEKVRTRHYDVVLMDMQMPVMDGLTATREIRRLPGTADLPILAMTANAMAGDRQRCLDAGMNDHIAKPIDPEGLTRKLLEWVRPVDPSRRVPSAPPKAQGAAGGGQVALAVPMQIDALRRIEGLEVDTGLRQSMGRESLYLELLRKLVSGQRDVCGRIGEACAASRPADAERLAHTLKGVAAQVGAVPLAACAAALESAIRERRPQPELDVLLDAVGARLAPLIGALSDALAVGVAETAPDAGAGVPDPAKWAALAARMRSLLKDDDAESVPLFEAESGVFRAALGGDYDRFAQAVRNFDFPDGLTLLEAAAAGPEAAPGRSGLSSPPREAG